MTTRKPRKAPHEGPELPAVPAATSEPAVPDEAPDLSTVPADASDEPPVADESADEPAVADEAPDPGAVPADDEPAVPADASDEPPVAEGRVMLCRVTACDRKAMFRGLCGAHYASRRGDGR